MGKMIMDDFPSMDKDWIWEERGHGLEPWLDMETREWMSKTMQNFTEWKGIAFAYFRAWVTASQMLEDRGYTIQLNEMKREREKKEGEVKEEEEAEEEEEDSDGDFFNITYWKFCSRYEGQEGRFAPVDLDIIATRGSDKVLVSFRLRWEVVNSSTVHDICWDTDLTQDITRLMLVSYNGSQIPQHQHLQITRDTGSALKVEIFGIAQLLVNMIRNHFHLKYEMIIDEDERQLLSLDDQAQSISSDTLLAQYFGLEKGGFIKATSARGSVYLYKVV